MTNQSPSVKPRRGCLFYGGIAAIVCLVAILVAFLLAMHMFKKVLNEYTDTRPAALPAVTLTAEQVQEVQRRVDRFQDAVSTGRPTPPLELTAEDINAIVASREDLQGLKDKAYVSIKGEKITAQVSVPMEKIGLPMFKGRYLNGEATFSVFVENGLLRIIPSSVSVKGRPLPDTYMERLRRENLAQAVNENSKASVALNRIQTIEVRDGKVIITPKQEK